MINKEKKEIKMVLYKMHDYDLVKYYVSLKDHKLKNPAISFASVMRKLITDYVSGEEMSAPKINTFSAEQMPSKIIVRFKLDVKTDKKAIELIEHIRDRQINSFLKSLLRRCLDLDGLRCYYQEDYAPDSELGLQKAADRKEKQKKKYEKVEETFIRELREEKPARVMSFEKADPVAENETEPEQVEDVGTGTFDFIGSIGNINKY
jgi:hypothetical protein